MDKHIAILLTGLFLLILGLPIQAQNNPPNEVIYDYYVAINDFDYATAYALWTNPHQTFAQFQNGFTDTSHVDPYLKILPANVSGSIRVPAALVSYKTDGSQMLYVGCFNMVQNVATGYQWRISSGNFQPTNARITRANIRLATENDCTGRAIPFEQKTASPEPYNEAAVMIKDYFNFINHRSFNLAYDYWLTQSPSGIPLYYRPTYDKFVAGYADTAFVTVYTGDYLPGWTAVGRDYINGELPAMLVARKMDGSYESYFGCYLIGISGKGPRIVTGFFQPVVTTAIDGVSIVNMLDSACTNVRIVI